MGPQLQYDPTIANLTPEEFERMVYVEPWATTPRMSFYLGALHEAEQGAYVRETLENHNLDFDDTKVLDKDIEKLVDRDAIADEYLNQLRVLVTAIEMVTPLLDLPAKRGSQYAAAVLAGLNAAVNKVNTEV